MLLEPLEHVVNRKAYVHVYTGDGKGKTTAAFGLALRASGHGMRTYIGQFMKGRAYGEINALKDNPYITIAQFADAECLLHKEEVNEKHIQQAYEGLQHSREAMLSGRFQLVVLDEINVAIWFGLVTEKQILNFLDERPGNLELVLTGRYACESLMERAHVVTEMRCVKHYHDQGVCARDGIER